MHTWFTHVDDVPLHRLRFYCKITADSPEQGKDTSGICSVTVKANKNQSPVILIPLFLHVFLSSVSGLPESGSTPVCVYMRDEVCNVLLTLPFSRDESEFYGNTAVCPCVCR